MCVCALNFNAFVYLVCVRMHVRVYMCVHVCMYVHAMVHV